MMDLARKGASGPNQLNIAYGPEVDNGNSADLATDTIDWTDGLTQVVTMTANTAIPLFHGWPVGKTARGILRIKMGAGGFTPTLPAVKLPTGFAFTTTAGYDNLVDLYWSGSQLFASLVKAYAP